MRIIERFADMVQGPHDVGDQHGSVLLERLLEGIARDERHRKVQEIFMLTGREKWDDVRVLKLRGDLDFATEPASVYVGDQLRREELDDDFSSQYAVHFVDGDARSEEHTSELQSLTNLVCR